MRRDWCRVINVGTILALAAMAWGRLDGVYLGMVLTAVIVVLAFGTLLDALWPGPHS